MVLNRQSANEFDSDSFEVTQLPRLQDIDNLRQNIKSLLQEFKQELTALYGSNLMNLVLYGSYARHEETEGSDIDVLVVLEECSPIDEILKMGDAKTKVLLEYGELVSVVPVSQNAFFYKDSPLLRNVRQEGILV